MKKSEKMNRKSQQLSGRLFAPYRINNSQVRYICGGANPWLDKPEENG
ncbi:MAG: hypothetical protein AAFQ94_13080 [Bacteroidota bacterium]